MYVVTVDRNDLAQYWQKLIAIEKITEFQKHHCSHELKEFLEVEENTKKVRYKCDVCES